MPLQHPHDSLQELGREQVQRLRLDTADQHLEPRFVLLQVLLEQRQVQLSLHRHQVGQGAPGLQVQERRDVSPLRIQVHQQRLPGVLLCQGHGQVDAERRLADAALGARDRDGHRHPRRIGRVLVLLALAHLVGRRQPLQRLDQRRQVHPVPGGPLAEQHVPRPGPHCPAQYLGVQQLRRTGEFTGIDRRERRRDA